MTTNFAARIVHCAPPPDVSVIDCSRGVGPTEARAVTAGELEREASRFAAVLAGRGVEPGSAVAILARNSARYLACFFGAVRAGAALLPVNLQLPRETIDAIFSDCDVALAIGDAEGLSLVPGGTAVLSIDSNETGPREIVPFLATDDHPALLLTTSGSTGIPKAVIHTHGTLSAMLLASGALQRGDYRLRGIVAAPMYHMNGLMFATALLMGGGSVVVLPRFDAARFVDAIETHRVALVTGVPTMMAMIRRLPGVEKRDLSSVLAVQLGSAPLSEAIIEQTRAIFPNATVTNVYGTTETGVPFGRHPEGLPTPVKSVGCALPSVVLRLVDGAGPDEGVLEVRSPAIMAGYRNRPEDSAARLRDGWYRTGDVFRRDADGFFYFVGREDDMFVCGGENVYPAAVERVLERIDGVAEVCVVPVSDVRRGAIPVAFISRTIGSGLDAEAVKAFCLANAPAAIHPRHVYFVERMPLNGVGKIDRRSLAAEAARLVGDGPGA